MAQEDGFELIHTRVGEEQRGIVEGDAGGGGGEGVRLRCEVLDEGGSDERGGPFE